MTQIVVTLENEADSTLLQKMIENMKGVLKTTLRNKSGQSKRKADDEWIDGVRSIRRRIDSSIIDMSDDRTSYIMSK